MRVKSGENGQGSIWIQLRKPWAALNAMCRTLLGKQHNDPALLVLLLPQEVGRTYKGAIVVCACSTGRLHTLIQAQPDALNEHLADFDSLSPTVKGVLIDVVPMIGSRYAQLWLVKFLHGQPGLEWSTRAIAATHQIKLPEKELLEAIFELSLPTTEESRTISHAALLALGSIAGRTTSDNEDVFRHLVKELQLLKMSQSSTEDVERMGAVLRVLGNQGHDDLLDHTPWFHNHASLSVRETAAHVLSRVQSPDAEVRLLWVVEADPNVTTRAAAVMALQDSSRNNTNEVADTFEWIQFTQGPDLDEILESRMMQYLKVESPAKFSDCNTARELIKQDQRRKMQSLRYGATEATCSGDNDGTGSAGACTGSDDGSAGLATCTGTWNATNITRGRDCAAMFVHDGECATEEDCIYTPPAGATPCRLNAAGTTCAVQGGNCAWVPPVAGAYCRLNANKTARAVEGGDCVYDPGDPGGR